MECPQTMAVGKHVKDDFDVSRVRGHDGSKNL